MIDEERGTVYVYRPHKNSIDCTGVAYAEDGQELASHISSSYGWFRHDMGLEGSEWHHEQYRAKYPGGFDLIEVIGPEALKEAVGVTDGQSEAQQYIDTSHPALRHSVTERIDQHRERYEQLKRNARYGVPPWTVDDCRFMVWLLDGELIGERKRCEACGGSGDQESVGFIRVKGTDYPLRPDCEPCNGTGYVG